MELVNIKRPRVLPRHLVYRAFKRWMDLTISIVSLPFTLPVLALAALAIYMDDGRPVLFVQDRIGKGGRPFKIYKFRTMALTADNPQSRAFMQAYVKGEISESEHSGEVYKPLQSCKILRIGRFLRKTSLDELPQLYNVLKGQMSIVGPRPNVLWEVEAYRAWHHERLEVLPGITGLAQVRGRSCIDFNSLVRYDVEYIEKQSLALDLKILWWTFRSIIAGKGAR